MQISYHVGRWAPLLVGVLAWPAAAQSPVRVTQFGVHRVDRQHLRVAIAAAGPVRSYVLRLHEPVPNDTKPLPGFFLWRAVSDGQSNLGPTRPSQP